MKHYKINVKLLTQGDHGFISEVARFFIRPNHLSPKMMDCSLNACQVFHDTHTSPQDAQKNEVAEVMPATSMNVIVSYLFVTELFRQTD